MRKTLLAIAVSIVVVLGTGAITTAGQTRTASGLLLRPGGGASFVCAGEYPSAEGAVRTPDGRVVPMTSSWHNGVYEVFGKGKRQLTVRTLSGERDLSNQRSTYIYSDNC